MKKFVKYFLILFLFIIVTGCDASEEDVGKIFENLKKEKIVESDYIKVDTATETSNLLFHSTKKYYIYKNRNGLIAIHYEKNNNNNECDYTLSIYNNVVINGGYENEVNTNDESYTLYENKSHTLYNKYVNNYDNTELTNEKEYCATEKNYIFLKKMIFSELQKSSN